MRIRRLVVAGFGPFAHRQEVDFAALDAAGLFLITGRTGSGKSSLLDAVCFALYGSAPRYEGGKGRLRSDLAGPDDATRVELEFDAGGERWRVERSPEHERPKRRGEGTTLQREEARLYRREGDEWVGLAARAVDVAELLAPVLQLTREQFLQVILLAQGRFQQFLRARSEERVALLRALFGTERFERFEQELVQRARALEQAVAGVGGALETDLLRLADAAGLDAPPEPADAPAAVAALAERAAEAAALAASARAAFRLADGRLAEQVRVADLQRRRSAATEALRALTQQADRADAARGRLAAAVRALPVVPAADRLRRADAASTAARAALTTSERAAGGPVPDPAAGAAAAETALGALAAPLADETALPRLSADADRAEAALARAAAALEAAEQQALRLPVQRAAVAAERSAAGERAALLPAAEDAVRRAAAAVAGAEAARDLLTEASAADRRHAEALAAERDAAEHTRRLVEARLAGAAALLAETLQPGGPCPVCGALEHPAPAPAGPDRVDDEAVSAAQRAQDAALDARVRAGAEAAAVRVDLAAARAASQGLEVEAARLAEAAAAAALQQAEHAEQRAVALLADLQALEAAEARAAETVDAARLAADEQRALAVRARLDADAARQRVAAARGDHASVADRAARLRAERDALRGLEAAARSAATAEDEQRRAAAVVEGLLAESGFDDLEQVRAAALPGPEREALDARIRRHDEAVAAAGAQLGDPEVAGAPAEPADVQGAVDAKSRALDAQHDADAAAADLAARVDHAAVVAERVAAASAAIAADRDRLQVIAPLAAVVRGGGGNSKRMRLEAYVLAARLEQIVAAANLRLATMTDGRYTLRHDDGPAERNAHSGLGLDVMDEHTGRARSIVSLSGGETFLASLALALGLAEVVSAEAGGVRLETLFVDEGFGSLDRQTLDTAMETLDSLRAGGRVVGLISHVEAMQEDIPAGLHVERGPDGSSTVRMRAAVPA